MFPILTRTRSFFLWDCELRMTGRAFCLGWPVTVTIASSSGAGGGGRGPSSPLRAHRVCTRDPSRPPVICSHCVEPGTPRRCFGQRHKQIPHGFCKFLKSRFRVGCYHRALRIHDPAISQGSRCSGWSHCRTGPRPRPLDPIPQNPHHGHPPATTRVPALNSKGKWTSEDFYGRGQSDFFIQFARIH